MIALLWLRPLWQRPARAVGTVLGVAIGVASVVSTGLASRAAVASMTSDVEALTGADRLELTREGGVPLGDMERLRPLCGDVVIAPVVEGTALVPARGELVRLLGVDGLTEDGSGGFALEAGARDADRAREELLLGRGAVLSRGAARRLGTAAGGMLELVIQARRVELPVLALFEPPSVPAAWERVVVLDVALAQELLGRIEHVDRLELRPRHALDPEALAARVRELLPAGFTLGPASLRREQGERFVRSLSFNLTALAGVSVLVAIVLVATTLATSVVQRRSSIAVLRALGASRAQLALALLLEAALLGILGGALGVLLGWLGARFIAADVHQSFATLAEGVLAGAVRLEPEWIAAGILLGCASALVASFLALQEAWRVPPLLDLRGRGFEDVRPGRGAARAALVAAFGAGAWLAARQPAWNGRPVAALLSALFLLAILLVLSGPLIELLARAPVGFLGLALATPLRLAQAALRSARGRAAWAASAVGVAVALAVSMTTMVSSFRGNVVEWTRDSFRADLHLRPLSLPSGASPGRLAPEAVRVALELFGPERVDPYNETTASVRGEPVVLGGAAFGVVAREGGVPFLDGRSSQEVFAEALRRGAAVVNEPFARRFGLGTGERVTLTTADHTVEREIAGVYRDFSGHTGRVVLDLGDFLGLQPDEGAQGVGIFLPEGADVEQERARLLAALGGRFEIEVLDHREVRAQVMQIFERTFAVTVALQLIASLVAALAVVLVLSALVRERVRDLAVVRVLGGSLRQLATLVASQALLLGLAGALGGLVMGVAVGYVLVAVVNLQSFGWSLSFELPASALWTAGAVVPACLAAGLVPALLSLRAQPQEALREAD